MGVRNRACPKMKKELVRQAMRTARSQLLEELHHHAGNNGTSQSILRAGELKRGSGQSLNCFPWSTQKAAGASTSLTSVALQLAEKL